MSAVLAVAEPEVAEVPPDEPAERRVALPEVAEVVAEPAAERVATQVVAEVQ